MAAGDFKVKLRDDTPTSITQGVLDMTAAQFGHILVTSVRLADAGVSHTNLKAVARYAGVLRGRDEWNYTGLYGAGLTTWISDEDGKDDKSDTDVANYFGNLHFDVVFNGLIPVALTAGTVTDIVVANGYQSLNPAGVNRKKVMDDACAYFAGEYRVNANFTIDAGPAASLWPTNTTPTVALLSAGASIDGGRDIGLTGMVASIDPDTNVEDVGTYVIVVDSNGNAVGRYGGTHASLKDPQGNALRLRRIVQSAEQQATASSGDIAALAQYNRFLNPRQEIRVQVSGLHDVGLDIQVGDAVWVYAPDGNVVDSANQIYFRGQTLFPVKARVQSMTTPIVDGMGVYFIGPTASPTVVDLTDYIEFETGATTLEIGAAARGLPFKQGLARIGVGPAE